jgi:probable HAF family extracellular repeat protein
MTGATSLTSDSHGDEKVALVPGANKGLGLEIELTIQNKQRILTPAACLLRFTLTDCISHGSVVLQLRETTMKSAVRLGLLILSSFASLQVIWAQSYTFTPINGIGRPSGINGTGQIVGYTLGGEQTHGFLYTNGDVTSIMAPGSRNTFAYGINNAGQIVGSASGSTSSTYGFLYANNNFMIISVPGSGSTIARGINDNGQIVGTAIDSGGRQNGFLYNAGTFTALTVPGNLNTYAYGINNSGQIVGTFSNSDGHQSGFLYNKGNFTTIDVPDSTDTLAYGINNLGQIVGSFIDDNGTHGFVYASGTFTTLDAPGVPSNIGTLAVGINDSSEVVGFATTAFLAIPAETSSLVTYPQSRVYSYPSGSPATYIFAANGGVPAYSWKAANLPDGLTLIATGNTAAVTGRSDVPSPLSALNGMSLILPSLFEIETADQSGQAQTNFYLAAVPAYAFPQFFENGAEQNLSDAAETRMLIGLQAAIGIQSCGTGTACQTVVQKALNPALLSSTEASLSEFANSLGLPDSNFKSIVMPQQPVLEPITPGGDLSPDLVAALNNLILNEQQQTAFYFALLGSLDRASGAALAHDEYWRLKQLQTAKWYALQLTSMQGSEPTLLQAVATALSGTTLDLKLDPQLVASTRRQIAQSGFTSDQTALLLKAGITQGELPFLQRAIAGTNYLPTANSLSEALQSQWFVTAAKQAALALASFGGDRNNDGKVDCSDVALVKAAMSTREGDPGFNVMADVNTDGAVDDLDLSWVVKQLPAGLSCQ